MRTLRLVGIIACTGALIACGDDSETNTSSGNGGSSSDGGSSSTNTAAGGGGSSSTNVGGGGNSTTGTAGSGGGTGGACTFSPACVDDPNTTVLAVTNIRFGEATDAWKDLGFDLDGVVSSSADSSTYVCQAHSGAQTKVYDDGTAGIDNAFGAILAPFLDNAGFPQSVNNSIADGGFTMMVALEGLTASPDQPLITAKFYAGYPLDTVPKFDGTDCWPVTPESLVDPSDLGSAKAVFDMSQIAADHLSSGIVDNAQLTLASDTFGSVTITIHQVRLEFQLDADHNGATAGLIGGILDTSEFKEAMEIAAGSMGSFYCTVVDDIVPKASDIMKDGSVDPSATCNGISIGLGFDMKRVSFGGIGCPSAPGVNTCP